MKGQAALQTAIGIAITLVCLLGVNWFGIAGAIFNLLTPIAASYLCLRFGMQAGVVLVTVVSLLLLQLAPLPILAMYIGLFAVASLLLPWFLRRGMPWDKAVLSASLGSVVTTAVLVLFVMYSEGLQFGGLLAKMLDSEVEQAMQLYRDSGLSESQLQELQGVVEQIAAFIRQSFFGLYVSGVLAIQLLNLAILQRLNKGYYRIIGIAFANWRLPAYLVWGLIAAGFAMLAPLEPLALVGRNLLTLLLPLYFLQGLAVVSSYLQRKAYPPALKGMIYVMVFILNPLPLIITGVGVFDLWIDFRRPRKKDI